MKKEEMTREQKKSKAYSQATARLRKEQREAWNRLLQEEYQKVGIQWTPPLTEREKAKQEIMQRLEEYPDLLEQLAGISAVKEAMASVRLDKDPKMGTRSYPTEVEMRQRNAPGAENPNVLVEEHPTWDPTEHPEGPESALPPDPRLPGDEPDPALDFETNEYADGSGRAES